MEKKILMSKNAGCRWWKVNEEEIEPGGRRWWRATVADQCWRWRTTKTDGGVCGGRMAVTGSGGRWKQTMVFVEEKWQRLAVEDSENKWWCSWRKRGTTATSRLQMLVVCIF